MKSLTFLFFMAFATRGFGQSNFPGLDPLVEKIIHTHFLQGCVRGSTYAWDKPEPDLTGFGYEVYEFKNFSYTTVADSLTEKDKLDGYEWKGKLVIRASHYRRYTVSGRNSDLGSGIFNHWREWNDIGDLEITDVITKKKGSPFRALRLDGGESMTFADDKPDCAMIRGLRKN
jgi:hypothetical protein